MMIEHKYKLAIASTLNTTPEQIFLYWKGRVALFAILKAMGIQKDDEIILPAFTCVVVPNAIIYLGAKPVYVDINPDTLNMDIELIEKAITTRTKVIICQNTFGLSSNIEKLISIANKHKLFTIEDCTHGFGGMYNGKPNGSYCDAAFYSTQWNKPFSTGIGGFSSINNPALVEKVKGLDKLKIKPSLIEQIVLTFLIIFNKYVINRFTYWQLIKLYRFLSHKNLIIGSNRGEELSSISIPPAYFKDISTIQIREGIKAIDNIVSMNNLRKNNAVVFSNFLQSNNKIFVKKSLFDNHLFLRYPLIVTNRGMFIELAEKAKISLGDWFLSPIHPVQEKFELWGIDPENFPQASRISKKIVNLPTDATDNAKILHFLHNNLALIE